MTKRKKTESAKTKSPKEEKLFNNLLRVTYEYVKGRRYNPQSKEALIEKLRIHHEHVDIFESVLKDLKESGHVHVEQEKIVAQSESAANRAQIVTGTIKVHPRGFGFVVPDDPTLPDIFIPKPFMLDAIDADSVEVLVSPVPSSEKGPDGKILRVVSRERKQLVGTIYCIQNDTAMAYCGLLGEKATVVVEKPQNKNFTVGDRLLLDVTDWGSKTESTYTKVSKFLGHISDATTDIPTAILEHGIYEKFPSKAVEEAESFGDRVTKEDLKDRLDLRELECFTIDPDTAKDYDDALSLTFSDGIYTLGVHIADVSHYVKKDSALDVEAARRCNSTYFPGKCVPMLPNALSDNLCSLREGVLRLTVSVFVEIDQSGTTKTWKIARSVIKSKKRFTYKQAKAILDGKTPSKHKPTLELMLKLCNLLKDKRAERGSVQLFMPEFVVKVDDEGMPSGTEIIEYDVTHQLVEEFMLKANEIVAYHLTKEGKNVTFRVHEEPAKESLAEFSALASAFGYNISHDPTPQEIQAFFQSLDTTSQAAQYLATCYIRSMRLACYSPDNIGHYGLSLEHYCHFTSPIRRYVDTIVHRLLFEDGVDRNVLVKICNDASERERISAKAEGSVILMKKLRLLQQVSAKDSYRQYEAVVTRIKPFGIYFDVLEFMLEGFLHVSELDDDYFEYNAEEMKLVGRHLGLGYKAGDRLLVMMRHVDLIQQLCSWHLVTHSSFKPIKSLPSYHQRDRKKKHPKQKKKFRR